MKYISISRSSCIFYSPLTFRRWDIRGEADRFRRCYETGEILSSIRSGECQNCAGILNRKSHSWCSIFVPRNGYSVRNFPFISSPFHRKVRIFFFLSLLSSFFFFPLQKAGIVAGSKMGKIFWNMWHSAGDDLEKQSGRFSTPRKIIIKKIVEDQVFIFNNLFKYWTFWIVLHIFFCKISARDIDGSFFPSSLKLEGLRVWHGI